MRRISILGATGSIGQSTIDLIRRDKQSYDAVALTGGRNIEQLARDAVELGAKLAVTCDPALYGSLRDRLEGTGIEAAAGDAAVVEAASRPAD